MSWIARALFLCVVGLALSGCILQHTLDIIYVESDGGDMPKVDAQFIDGVVPVRSGGTGIPDSGPFGSVLTSDGVRWVSLDPSTNPFLSAASIFIDPVNGSDGNDGLKSTPNAPATAIVNPGPLKTWAELRRRVIAGGGRLTAATTTFTILSALPATDPFTIDFGSTGAVTVIGTPTVVRSGNTTASTARAGNTPTQMTDGGVGSWNTDITTAGRFIFITSGAALNAVLFPVLDLGAGAVRTTNPFTTTQQTLVAAQSYDVRAMTNILGPAVIAPASGTWTLQLLAFQGAVNYTTPVAVSFSQCDFAIAQVATFRGTAQTWSNCMIRSGSTFTFIMSSPTFRAGGLAGQITASSSNVIIQNGWLSQGAVAPYSQIGGFTDWQDAAIFDWTGTAIRTDNGKARIVVALAGTSAAAGALPYTIGPDGAVDSQITPTIIASNPAAALKVGFAANLAAWPAAAQSRTIDPNSNAVFVHE